MGAEWPTREAVPGSGARGARGGLRTEEVRCQLVWALRGFIPAAAGTPGNMEASMKHVARLAVAVAGLVAMLGSTPSSGRTAEPDSERRRGQHRRRDGSARRCCPVVRGSMKLTGRCFSTAFGDGALGSTTAGVGNTAFGFRALSTNSGGSSNTASGELRAQAATPPASATPPSAWSRSAATPPAAPTPVSVPARSATPTTPPGDRNTAVGAAALTNSSGNNNIAIGVTAGRTLVTGNKNIYLGNPGNGDESRTLRLGHVQIRTFIAGVNTTSVTGTPVLIDANGQLGTQLSRPATNGTSSPWPPAARVCSSCVR